MIPTITETTYNECFEHSKRKYEDIVKMWEEQPTLKSHLVNIIKAYKIQDIYLIHLLENVFMDLVILTAAECNKKNKQNIDKVYLN